MSISIIATILFIILSISSQNVDGKFWSTRTATSHPHWTLIEDAPLKATQTIILALKEANMDKLEQLFNEIHDPKHPSWLQHLTQREIHDMTALPVKYTDDIQSWLKDGGVPQNSIQYGLASGAIQFTASVKVINKLFNTTMAIFEHKQNKNRALAHIGDAHLPDHFSGMIEFADGLHYLPIQNKRHIQILEIDDIAELSSEDSTNNRDSNSANENINAAASSRRLLQSGSFSPIYPVNSLYSWYNADNNAGYTKTNSTIRPNITHNVVQFYTSDGNGGTVQNSYSPADLAIYSRLWSNSQSTSTLVVDYNVGGPNDASNPTSEPSLDIQSITAWNPRASAYHENQEQPSNQMFAWSTNFLARSTLPQIASISYGIAEVIYITGGTARVDGIPATTYLDRTNQQFMKIGLRGTTILASSGDDGANSEQNTQCNYASSYEYSQYGLLADFPASSPYVTAVGGTAINDGNAAHYSSTMAGGALMCNNFDTTKFSSYGLNTPATARSYRCFQSAGTVSRASQAETVCSLDNCGITSGGGFSRQFAMPSWQSSVVNAYVNRGASGMPSGKYDPTMRATPDVSMYGSAFPVIVGRTFGQASGTSLSSPLFASVISQLNTVTIAALNRTIGFANPLLYQMYADRTSGTTATFFDITSGNNNCPRSTSWNTDAQCIAAGCKGFPATAGFDCATGLGVPNVNNMISYVTALVSNGTLIINSTTNGTNSAVSMRNARVPILVTLFVAVTLFSF